MRTNFFIFLLSCILWLITSCGDDATDEVKTISILSSTVNGSNSNNANLNIPVDVTIELVFSSAVDPVAFESLFSIAAMGVNADYTLTYTNATSKVTATAKLAYSTTYTVSLGTNPIGAKGERLASPLSFTFTTAEDDIIRSAAPCISVGTCLRSVELPGSLGMGTFEFYSNYPIFEEKAQWENLTQAIFVVHGASHNADDYFTYLTNTLTAMELSASTVLIAPLFRNTSTGSSEDFYWASVNYRDGVQSSNNNKISSFKVLDLLIDQLANKERFPVMEKIIVTGQSSGGNFTHVYAPANNSEASHTNISFDYIVGESQYFYYPDGQRINESTNNLYTPAGCASYEIWPMGYNAAPPYLTGVTEAQFNNRFVNRSIYYLLGGGNEIDGSLNTTDCQATLLGSTRYMRGVNMFRYMDLVYTGSHNHSKVVVPGITHNGSQIYQSTEFKNLLGQLLQ